MNECDKILANKVNPSWNFLYIPCNCWHVYKKSVLVIDGKNNNNDGMYTSKNNNNDNILIIIDGKKNNDGGMVAGNNSSDVGRFIVGRQKWKTGRQGRSATMMAWKDHKRNNEEKQ
jgi:hypothetical protein